MVGGRHCERCNLTSERVNDAVELAHKGTTAHYDYCDISQPYFVLRVRGHSLSWLVKTRANTIKIGHAMPPEKRKRLSERRMRASKVGEDKYLVSVGRLISRVAPWAQLGPPKSWDE